MSYVIQPATIRSTIKKTMNNIDIINLSIVDYQGALMPKKQTHYRKGVQIRTISRIAQWRKRLEEHRNANPYI